LTSLHAPCIRLAAIVNGNTHPPTEAGLPYELRAVETALAFAFKVLEAKTVDVERQTLPSLERLTRKACALHH
jgi:hypothetical protein